MKILMMALIVGLMGCGSGGGSVPVIIPDESHCSDLTVYRKVSDLSKTTYQISVNTCNTIDSVIMSSDERMLEVVKVIDTVWGEDELVTVSYNINGFDYTDSTVGRFQNTGTQAIAYNYINGDNFITSTHLPSYEIRYIYENEEGFNKILNSALYEIVILEVKEAIDEL